jgi:hypothetical protein
LTESLLRKQILQKFRENELIQQLSQYVNDTYSQHYAQDKIQAFEVTVDAGHGIGACISNSFKYLKRYEKKGDNPEQFRKDLMKNLHYSLLLLYCHDKKHSGIE